MLNVSAYPLCATRLRFQNANLNDPAMTPYWAAVSVAFDIRDAELAEHGGFNFNSQTDENGRRLLSELEKLLATRAQRRAANSTFAHDGLRSMLGARGVKTSLLKGEDDYWTAAETLFPGCIKRTGGMAALYVQINSIPKKRRQALGFSNLKSLPADWISDATNHQAKLAPSKPKHVEEHR
jgi:hypothetical protein